MPRRACDVILSAAKGLGKVETIHSPEAASRSAFCVLRSAFTVQTTRSRTSRPFSALGVHAVEHLLHHQPVLAGHLVRAAVAADLDEVAHLVLEVVPLRHVRRRHVHHVAAVVGEDLARLPVRAALLAHDLDVPDVLLDVRDEARLDREHRAVVEADHADGEVLDGVGLVVPVRPHARDARTACCRCTSRCCPVAVTGPRRADHVVRRLEDVHADVDHRPAALEVLAAEHAPVRDAAAAQAPGADVEDLPERARRRSGRGSACVLRLEAVLEADDQLLAAAAWPRRPSAAPSLRVHGHRLLDEHVLAGVERVDRVLGVQAVGRADADGVELRHLAEHLLVVGVHVLDAERVLELRAATSR